MSKKKIHTLETRSVMKQPVDLFANEDQLLLAMRGTNDGVWDWNLETDDVYYSPRWKKMLGYEEHELKNTLETWSQLVHPDDKNNVLEKAQDYLSGKSDVFEVEMRMLHKDGHEIFILSRAFSEIKGRDGNPVRLVGTHVDITEQKKSEAFYKKNAEILEMIAVGKPALEIYDAIALMYEARHPGLRCSMLELQDGTLLHGGAPSMPKEYCDAVHGLKIGPDVGSCGTSTYTGKRCLVENIETDPKWDKIKDVALPHGMRSCWSEPIKNSKGKVLGAFGMYYDYPALPNEDELEDLISAARLAGIIMEREQQQKRIRELAYNDELTGLASRAHFYLYIDDLIKTSRRHGRQFSLLYIDLDNFKDVNDSLGHDAGDILLKEISERLSNASREIDFIARLSGDEFCIVIEDMSELYAAGDIAQRCFSVVSRPVKLSGRVHTPTCSIGIAHFPNDGETVSVLLKAADTALYSAKEQGKNCFAFYELELTKKAEYRFQFEQYLREAIEKQQMSLLYQPQINSKTGEVIGVEALSRWYHFALGQVSPNVFIETAERIGMISSLTEWVLLTACKQAIKWQKQGFQPLRISVNISPSHFLDKNLVSLIKSVIDETGIEANQLELEVTESVVQTNPKNLSTFQDLKNLGVLLAIDDFGTGYSSFASLKHMNVDYLKIDKVFIDDMLVDNQTKILVESMIDIGHKLGHGIIAEGVEEVEQFSLLQKLGCESVQGYLFSEPVDSNRVSQLLKSRFSI